MMIFFIIAFNSIVKGSQRPSLLPCDKKDMLASPPDLLPKLFTIPHGVKNFADSQADFSRETSSPRHRRSFLPGDLPVTKRRPRFENLGFQVVSTRSMGNVRIGRNREFIATTEPQPQIESRIHTKS